MDMTLPIKSNHKQNK